MDGPFGAFSVGGASSSGRVTIGTMSAKINPNESWFRFMHSPFGITLAEWLTGNRPAAIECAALCSVITDALDVAHSNGAMHGGSNPSNI
jgi:hypothetical protein